MNFLFLCDLFGVAVFAVSGTLMAGRKSMDLFGVLVIAMVTAMGGGTLRDVILGHYPVSWIKDDLYIAVASIATTSVVLWVRLIRPLPTNRLLIADALGLAIATIIGTDVALKSQVSTSVAIIMGVMTGVAGGVMRDIICNEIPLVLQREVYATASIAGALAFTALIACGADHTTVSIVAMAIVFTVRIAAIRYQLSLPRFHLLDRINTVSKFDVAERS
jgi:uncharacterized membrane protein YeiH